MFGKWYRRVQVSGGDTTCGQVILDSIRESRLSQLGEQGSKQHYSMASSPALASRFLSSVLSWISWMMNCEPYAQTFLPWLMLLLVLNTAIETPQKTSPFRIHLLSVLYFEFLIWILCVTSQVSFTIIIFIAGPISFLHSLNSYPSINKQCSHFVVVFYFILCPQNQCHWIDHCSDLPINSF